MAKATFKCDKCDREEKNQVRYERRGLLNHHPCPCGGALYRTKFGALQIPEHMKAGSEDAETYDIASSAMRNSKLPSGRDKIYY
jgi:hypothetical protein